MASHFYKSHRKVNFNLIITNTCCCIIKSLQHNNLILDINYDGNCKQQWKDKAISFLNETGGEQNSITKKWEQLNVSCANAVDLEALLELKKYYCEEKRCLNCAVGNKLLKGKK